MRKEQRKDGDNGKLSLSYIKLIIENETRLFLFENVKGFGELRATESLRLKAHRRYCTTERLTNALEYGAPQDRDRILMFESDIVAECQQHKGKEIASFPWDAYRLYTLADVKRCRGLILQV